MILEGQNNRMYWYILRVATEEEKCVAHINEMIESRGLKDRIVDVRSFTEHVVVESDEYLPNSDDFPKRGLRSTKNSVWVKLSNGNYKRLRIVKRSPFGGMVFLKMEHDIDLFKMVSSWNSYFFFLNYPNPQVMLDEELEALTVQFDGKIPDLKEYSEQKGYLIVEGLVSDLQELVVEGKDEEIEDKKDDQEKLKQQDIQVKKSKIYSDLNINTYENINSSPNKFKFKKSSGSSNDKFKENDLVFIQRLGFSGVIQEINYDLDKVIVAVSMFGRKQPVECKVSEIEHV